MAGIGFRIQKILEGDTYVASIKAHFYSTVIFSGPWLISIVTLFLLNFIFAGKLTLAEITYFRLMIIYIYAFSLIAVGFFYLSVSRYLADKLYLKDQEAIVPVFNSLAIVTLAVQSCFGYSFFGALEAPFAVKFFALLIYLTISLLWLEMIFLTALRDYWEITKAFLLGAGVCMVLSAILGPIFRLQGYLAGYFIGHFLIVVMLALRIFVEFSSKRLFDREVFLFMLRNKILLFTGFFYNLAIWIDKIVFWFSPRSIEVSHLMRTFPEYETAAFFAYLTIIPALSIFLIQVETSFYNKYRQFYAQVLEKGTFSQIRQAKMEMVANLRHNLVRIVVNQGLLTLLAITFAPNLVGLFRLSSLTIPILRLCLLGAFLNCLLLILIIVILYFDFKDTAFLVTAVFLLTNGLFTYISSFMEIPFIGYGYVFSCLVSLAVAFYLLDYKLGRLEYLTFGLQPIGVHREEEIV